MSLPRIICPLPPMSIGHNSSGASGIRPYFLGQACGVGNSATLHRNYFYQSLSMATDRVPHAAISQA
jgi:hypothetical protein